jgi:hypothetical protein
MALPSPWVVAAAGEPRGEARPRFEVADIVRGYGPEYLRTHPTSAEQRRVLRALAACRTAALGGHVEACDDCGYRRIAYNSCLMGSVSLWGVQPVKRRCSGRLNAVWGRIDSP